MRLFVRCNNDQAMNRSLANVILGGYAIAAPSKSSGPVEKLVHGVCLLPLGDRVKPHIRLY